MNLRQEALTYIRFRANLGCLVISLVPSLFLFLIGWAIMVAFAGDWIIAVLMLLAPIILAIFPFRRLTAVREWTRRIEAGDVSEAIFTIDNIVQAKYVSPAYGTSGINIQRGYKLLATNEDSIQRMTFHINDKIVNWLGGDRRVIIGYIPKCPIPIYMRKVDS